jgi:hypothetical protein
MSDESQGAAAPEYVPMLDANAAPASDKPVYENDLTGIESAGLELDEARRREAAKAPRVVEADEPTPRKYFRTENGQFTSEESPANETLSLKRASDDLTRVRAEEAAAVDAHVDANVAEVTDAVRSLDPQLLLGKNSQLPEQPSPELTPEAQQQQQAQNEQAEFERALANPRLRQALESEVGKLEQSRAAYSAAATQAFELSAAATFAPPRSAPTRVAWRLLILL